MSEHGKQVFDACLKAPFATLGIVADDKYLLGLHFLPATVPAKPPPASCRWICRNRF